MSDDTGSALAGRTALELAGLVRDDALVLSVAKQLEMLRPWARHAPFVG